jgi:ABC-2 type transport system ATP-binding protein
METVIECQDLCRTFVSKSMLGKKREVVALAGLNFDIPRGIVFALLGPNGSGKTTTIRILATLLTPTSGRAIVLGHDVMKETKKVKGRIGLILGGDRGLYGRLSAEENLRYFAALNYLSRKEIGSRVKYAIDLVGLSSVKQRPVGEFSRGMKQRLHIARGLLTDPEIIFMDEPTIGLDPLGAQELRDLIPKLVERGKTILLTTHYMAEADILSSKIAIISKGILTAIGTPKDIKQKFSKLQIIELICRDYISDLAGEMKNIGGIQRITITSDGPFQKVTVHADPNCQIVESIEERLGKERIKSIVNREPTLEEAYLSIVKE